MTPEGKVVAAIKRMAAERGGEVRKCHWEGRRGAPDLFVMLPGAHLWVEVKAPGCKPEPHQLREMGRMHRADCIAIWTDGNDLDDVGSFMDWLMEIAQEEQEEEEPHAHA